LNFPVNRINALHCSKLLINEQLVMSDPYTQKDMLLGWLMRDNWLMMRKFKGFS